MQVTETNSQGLKRQLRVVVPALELTQRFTARLDEVKDTVQLKGFRKGHVPVAHLKKVFGRSLMAEILQQTVDEKSRQALQDRKDRPALQPKIELPTDTGEFEKVMAGQSDLAFDMAYEVLPQIAITDLSQLKLERLTADVEEAAVDKAIAEYAERSTSYVAEEGRAGIEGDRLTLDFVGQIDGVEFEGGKGEGAMLVLGKGGFIPGFEDGLKGAKAGDDKRVEATFPADYQVETLKGKAAVFEVKVKEVARPQQPAIDDAFAKSLGQESVDKLRESVRAQLKQQQDRSARAKLKRQLLDELEKHHAFELPPSLVDGEFEGIWKQVTQGLAQHKRTFEDEGKTEDGAREEYRKIAERRVRLGLVIGEIGDKNKIEVSEDDLRRALADQVRRFPGQERAVYEYFEKTPGAINELRAPIFEEKVVDFVLELAKPSERKVSRDELLKSEDEAD